jgi:hypothetical protein
MITYHGWIVVEREDGYKPTYRAEWTVGDERFSSEAFRSSAAAIDFWDKKLDTKVLILRLPLDAYRVYTEDE